VEAPGGPVFGQVYPVHQDHPSWSVHNVIAYEDRGISEVDSASGAYMVDPTRAGIWALDLESGTKQRVVPFGTSPTWSHDGAWIAFEHAGAIYVADASGAYIVKLTHTGLNHNPAWYPSDSSLVYDSNATSSLYSLWRIDINGQNANAVCGQVGLREGSWSVTGEQLVGTSASGNYAQVHSLSAACEGTALTSMTATIMNHPTFSPDGRLVAFAAKLEASPTPEVWVMDSLGGNLHQVTVGGGWSPSWSPDGSHMVFARPPGGRYSHETGVLWTLDLESGSTTQLTEW